MPKTLNNPLDEIARFLGKPIQNSAEAAKLLLTVIQESENPKARMVALGHMFSLVRDIPLLKLLDDPGQEERTQKSAIPRSLAIAKAMVRIYLTEASLKASPKPTKLEVENALKIAQQIMLELFDKANDLRILYLYYMTGGNESNVEFKGPSLVSTPFEIQNLIHLLPEQFVDCLIEDELVPAEKKPTYFKYLFAHHHKTLPERSLYLIANALATEKTSYFSLWNSQFRNGIERLFWHNPGKLTSEDIDNLFTLASREKFFRRTLLHIISAAGDERAMLQLAKLEKSLGNTVTEVMLYKMASEAGGTQAHYYHAATLAADPANDAEVFRLVSNSSHIRAIYTKGNYLLTGRGTEKDINVALDCFHNYLCKLRDREENLSRRLDEILTSLSDNLTNENEIAFAKFIRKIRPFIPTSRTLHNIISYLGSRVISFEAKYWIATFGDLKISFLPIKNFSDVPIAVKRLIKEDVNQFVKCLYKDKIENSQVKETYFKYINNHKKLKVLLSDENKQVVEHFLRPKTSDLEPIKILPPVPRL